MVISQLVQAGGESLGRSSTGYEFYPAQARKARAYLGLKRIPGKHGFRDRYGIGVNAVDRYVAQAVQAGVPVVVVNQTGLQLGHVAERRVAVKYLPKSAVQW